MSRLLAELVLGVTVDSWPVHAEPIHHLICEHSVQEATAKVYITKLVAAKRQLRAAIRLFFAKEDELAIHTIAAAAYNLLAELKEMRGGNEAEDRAKTICLGLISMARSLQAGQLPVEVARDTYTIEILKKIAENIPLEQSIDISSIDVTTSESWTKAFWRDQNRIANFLKHADRDAGSAISLDQVNNLNLLVAASQSYESLAPDDLGFEGFILTIYLLASLDEEIDANNPFAKPVRELRAMPPDERITFCSYQLSRPRPADVE
jgi:hypothetical protein